MQQEAVATLIEHIVHDLLIALRAQRDGRQRLRLAAGKDSRSVRSRQVVRLDPYGSDVRRATAVEALALVEDGAAHGLFLHVVIVAVDEGRLFLQFLLGVVRLKVLHNLFEGLGALLLALSGDRDGVRLGVKLIVHLLAQLLVVLFVAIFTLHRLSAGCFQLLLHQAVLLDSFMGHADSLEHFSLLHLVHFAFHHHNVLIRCTHHDVNVSLLQLLKGGVDDKPSVDACHAHLRDRSAEGNVGDSQRRRCCQSSQRVGHIDAVGREQDDVDVHLRVIIVREEGAQYAVHQARSQDLVVRGLTLSARKATGETPEGRILLFVVHLKGHEIRARHRVFRATHRSQQHRVAHAYGHGSVGLLSQFPRFDGDASSVTQINRLLNHIHLVRSFYYLIYFKKLRQMYTQIVHQWLSRDLRGNTFERERLPLSLQVELGMTTK